MSSMQALDRNDYRPLYVQLADRIIQHIREKQLKPGDALPSQNELIDRFGVSQITIRQAMARLTTEGIITRIQGKGTFVAEPKLTQQIEGVQSLEGRLGEQGVKVQVEFAESFLAMPAQRIRQDLGLADGVQTFKIRRIKKADGAVLGLESRHVPLDVAGYFTENELQTQPFVDLLAKRPETKVARIFFHTRASLIMELEAELLGVSPATPVLVQYGVFYATNDRPVMAGRMTYLADKLEIQYEVRQRGDHQLRLIEGDMP